MRIVVDSSALLAVLLREPVRDRFIPALLDSQPVISIATLTETSLVLLGRRGAAALDELDRQIAAFRFEIVPVLADDHLCLRQALQFGKPAPGAGSASLRRSLRLRARQTAGPAAAI